jgi:hypothetical protein
MTTQKMTPKAIEIRNQMIADMAAKYGRSTVEAWANDPAKVSMINTMAQMTADAS